MANAKVSGAQHGAVAKAKMANPCPIRRGVLSVRMRSKATNGLTALLCVSLEYALPRAFFFNLKFCNRWPAQLVMNSGSEL